MLKKTSRFMDWLREELKKIQVKDITPPDKEVEEGEEVIGTLESLEVMKIFTLRARVWRETSRLIEEITLAASAGEQPEDQGEIQRKLRDLDNKMGLLGRLFRTCLLCEIPGSEEALIERDKSGNPSIGICSDWKIVRIPRQLGMPPVTIFFRL